MAERIRIGDVDFMVRRTVEQAPKATFLREFVKNAEEAAALAPEGSREVRLYPVLVGHGDESVRKLAIWNTGPGMSESELARAMDLSSSLGKTMGLDGNFGIGAKVSGLAVSAPNISANETPAFTVTVTAGHHHDTSRSDAGHTLLTANASGPHSAVGTPGDGKLYQGVDRIWPSFPAGCGL